MFSPRWRDQVRALGARCVFTEDLAAHVFHSSCGRPVRGVLPLPAGPEQEEQQRLVVDWTRCHGHGLCAHLVPELVQLDGQGYPVFLDMPVPPGCSSRRSRPSRCARPWPWGTTAVAPPPPSREPAKARLEARKGDNLKLVASTRSESGPDVDVDEAWIAEITDVGRQIPGPIT